MEKPQKQGKRSLIDLLLGNGRILALLFLFIVAFGSWSLTSIKKEGFPEVLVNIALVQVVYPGANAQQVEEQIVIPIESAIEESGSVIEYEMTARANAAIGFVTLDQNADLNDAVSELSDKVDALDFPEDAMDPSVQKIDAGGIASFMVAVAGPENVWDLYERGQEAKKMLEGISGVSKVTVLNELTPQISIALNAEKLEENGLNRTAVEQAISGSMFDAPVGSFTDENRNVVTLAVKKDVGSIEDIRNIPIGRNVVLSDVASVDKVLNNNEKYNRVGYRVDGEMGREFKISRTLLLAIKTKDNADILALEDTIDEELKELPASVTAVSVFSEAEGARLQISEITQSLFGSKIESWGALGYAGYLFGGLLLVVLLLFAFINLRVAILAALAIPLSLLSAIMVVQLLGIGLNTLVLFSLVLAIGLVVDPTIVFLESLQRFKQQGLVGREAARKTFETVGVGVLLAVLTNILVFVPFGIVSGFFGEIIKYIPATIIPAMAASLLVPVLFFVPIGARLLKPKGQTQSDNELAGVWPIAIKFGRLVKGLLRKGKKWAALRVGVFLLGLSLPVIVGGALINGGAIEMVQFSQPEDTDFMFVHADISSSWEFDKAVYDIVVPLQDEIAKQPEVKNFSFMEQNGNGFMLFMNLHPMGDREDEGMRKAKDVAADLNTWIKEQNFDADIEAIDASDGPPEDRFPIKVRLVEDDLQKLQSASDDVKAFLAGLEEVNVVKSSLDSQGGGVVAMHIDEQSNAPLVFGTVRSRLSEEELGSVVIDDTSFELISSIDPPVRKIDMLKDLALPIPGQTVSDTISDTDISEPITLRRINGERAVTVQASLKEDAQVLDVQKHVDDYLTEEKLTELGLNPEAAVFKGSADSITQSFTELFVALLVAIALIYILLVAFFRSFFEPFIILFAIPLGLVGVFAAVAITTGQLGFLELLGVVAMAGIVVNVTIILLDTANRIRRAGATPERAIARAVALRLRPIILTQLTAFGSLIPLVFYSPFWKGLAASIIFGIVTSALLSLFITPILYRWNHRLWPNVKGVFKRKKQPKQQKQLIV